MKETQNQIKKNSNKNSIIFKLFSLVRFTLASHIFTFLNSQTSKLSNKLPQSSYDRKKNKIKFNKTKTKRKTKRHGETVTHGTIIRRQNTLPQVRQKNRKGTIVTRNYQMRGIREEKQK